MLEEPLIPIAKQAMLFPVTFIKVLQTPVNRPYYAVICPLDNHPPGLTLNTLELARGVPGPLQAPLVPLTLDLGVVLGNALLAVFFRVEAVVADVADFLPFSVVSGREAVGDVDDLVAGLLVGVEFVSS